MSKIHPANSPPLTHHATSINAQNGKLPTSSVTVPLSTPASVTISCNNLAKLVGFHQTEYLIQHMPTLSNKKIPVQCLEKSPFIDPGEVASMNAKKSNKTPLPIPSKYSDVWHLDIGFGPCTSIGGMKYILMAVDCFSRYKLCCGLKKLTTSHLEAIKRLVRDVDVSMLLDDLGLRKYICHIPL